MLIHPLSISSFKNLDKKKVKKKVIEYWQQKPPLNLLIFFKPEYMSLNQFKPHPLWTTAAQSNPFEINI
jgi:hypothetical protein